MPQVSGWWRGGNHIAQRLAAFVYNTMLRTRMHQYALAFLQNHFCIVFQYHMGLPFQYQIKLRLQQGGQAGLGMTRFNLLQPYLGPGVLGKGQSLGLHGILVLQQQAGILQ